MAAVKETVDAVAELTQSVLGKQLPVIAITVQYIAAETWFIGGQSLAALDLAQLAVEITAIRRRNVRTVEPGPDAVIEENDIVVLLGTEDAVASAEIKLLQG